MDRTFAVRRVLIYTLAANAVIAIAKVAYGYSTNSISIISDGFHSIFDGSSNVIGLIGIRLASHPPDARHPYGHRKYETLFTIIIASMIFFTSFQIIRKVYMSFFEVQKTEVTAISFLVMLVTMAVNIVVSLYESRKGRELNSEFLTADAKHTQSDILVSMSVIIGLVFYRLGYHRADAIVGIVIVVLIGKIGYNILRHASDILVDSVRLDTASIEEIVNSVDGVKGCHDIRTRGTASSIFLDLHVLVDSSLSVEDAHEIADRVESALKDGFHSVADIVVHIEPV